MRLRHTKRLYKFLKFDIILTRKIRMKKIDSTLEKFTEKIPQDLWTICEIIKASGHKLYIVGGYIRDYLLGIKTTDIDICGTATPQQLEEILIGTDYKFKIINKKLGAYKIFKSDSEVEFEYTTLREEKYKKGHSPSEVNFVTNVEVDAQRRDFTVNAIYYDLVEQTVIDPCGGINDCAERVLKPVNNRVFDSDGLRIMRLLRFAYTKKLNIPENVMDAARLRTYLLRDITHERIAQEIRAISEFQHNTTKNRRKHIDYGYERAVTGKRNKNDIFSALDLLDVLMKFRIIDYIFPKLSSEIDMGKFYNLYETPIGAYEFFEENLSIGLAYLICRKLEDLNYELSGEFYYELLGADGLMFNKSKVKTMTIVLDGLLTLNKMNDNSFYVNYVQLYYYVLDEIIFFAQEIILNNCNEKIERLITTNTLMRANNIPRCMEELAINGQDIINRWPFMPQKLISSMLECAMVLATKERRNEKEFLLNELEKLIVRD